MINTRCSYPEEFEDGLIIGQELKLWLFQNHFLSTTFIPLLPPNLFIPLPLLNSLNFTRNPPNNIPLFLCELQGDPNNFIKDQPVTLELHSFAWR